MDRPLKGTEKGRMETENFPTTKNGRKRKTRRLCYICPAGKERQDYSKSVSGHVYTVQRLSVEQFSCLSIPQFLHS